MSKLVYKVGVVGPMRARPHRSFEPSMSSYAGLYRPFASLKAGLGKVLNVEPREVYLTERLASGDRGEYKDLTPRYKDHNKVYQIFSNTPIFLRKSSSILDALSGILANHRRLVSLDPNSL